MAAGLAVRLGDAQVLVGAGAVPAQDLDALVNVAGQLGEGLHQIGDAEPLALVAQARRAVRAERRHPRPRGCREPAVGGETLRAEHVGVGGCGTAEGVVLGAQLQLQQPRGQLLGVGAGLEAGLVVQPAELLEEAAQLAVGVVGPPDCLLDSPDGVFGQLDHRLGMALVKQRRDPVDHLADAVRVAMGRVIVHVVAARGHGTVDGSAEGGQVDAVRPLAGDLQLEMLAQALVHCGPRHEQLDQLVFALRGQVCANVVQGDALPPLAPRGLPHARGPPPLPCLTRPA